MQVRYELYFISKLILIIHKETSSSQFPTKIISPPKLGYLSDTTIFYSADVKVFFVLFFCFADGKLTKEHRFKLCTLFSTYKVLKPNNCSNFSNKIWYFHSEIFFLGVLVIISCRQKQISCSFTNNLQKITISFTD